MLLVQLFQVYASTVKLLTDQELEELGLCMGERKALRKLCEDAVKSKMFRRAVCQSNDVLLSTLGRTVCQEVRSVLSPLPRASGGSSSAGPSLLERRPKRKAKGKLAAEKYAPTPVSRGRGTSFQKKFVLIDYMGPDAPRKFALKESYVVMRGILPEVLVSAEESVVRRCLTEAVKHSDRTLSNLEPSQFEFLEACGKCLCTPGHNPGFMWTGRAVKELAGTGAIYLRLTVEREEESLTSDSDQSASGSEVKFVKIETPGE